MFIGDLNVWLYQDPKQRIAARIAGGGPEGSHPSWAPFWGMTPAKFFETEMSVGRLCLKKWKNQYLERKYHKQKFQV